MIFKKILSRYTPTQIRLRLRVFKIMSKKYDRPINRFRIEHWLRICKKIIMFFYNLRNYAYVKFKKVKYWITFKIDKLHIKLMLLA